MTSYVSSGWALFLRMTDDKRASKTFSST